MALTIDEFRDGPTRHGPRCTFGLLLEELDPDDRTVLEAALADPKVHGSRIAKVLQDKGHAIKDHTVTRHRAGGCSC